MYQPGRISTRHKNTTPNGNADKKKYIEWSSSDDEGEEDQPNICKYLVDTIFLLINAPPLMTSCSKLIVAPIKP